MSEHSNEPLTSNSVTEADAIEWLFSLIDQLQVTGTLEKVQRQVWLGNRARLLLTELQDELYRQHPPGEVSPING